MDSRLDSYLDKQDREYRDYIKKETKMTAHERPSDNISYLLLKFMLWRISICGLNKPKDLEKDPLGVAILNEAYRRGMNFPTRETKSTMTMGDEIKMLTQEFNSFILEQALTEYCYPELPDRDKPMPFFHENNGMQKSVFDTPGALAERKEDEARLENLRKFNEEHGI